MCSTAVQGWCVLVSTVDSACVPIGCVHTCVHPNCGSVGCARSMVQQVGIEWYYAEQQECQRERSRITSFLV